ncbi:hypothetical protein C806_04533 [Lachnospiraceae bacterium 3-1]|nr:hypothetical protein C806_04533 [Lachnospiraceae bacterium 3-1]
MDKIYIIVPAYNEEENIRSVITQWHPVAEKAGPDSRLVIIDDGSQDHTYQAALELKKQYPQLIVLTKANQGHGATVLYGYKYAICKGADYVFQTDSDGQTLPSEFSVFWENRQKCGLLIGQRMHRGDGVLRLFIARTLRLLLLVVFRVWVKDGNTPYRLMRCSQLREVLKKVPKDFFLSNVLITVIYTKKNLGVYYYPITFLPRQGGENSINLKKIFGIGKKSFRQFLALRRKVEE